MLCTSLLYDFRKAVIDPAESNKLGVEAAIRGDLKNAEKHWLDAINSNAAVEGFFFNLARLLNMQKRHQELLLLFRRCDPLKHEPEYSPQILLMVSNSAMEAGEATMALELLTRSHQCYPNHAETAIALSEEKIKAGELKSARDIILNALSYSSHDPSLTTNLAIVEAEMGNISEAKLLHQQLVKSFPDTFLAHYNYGQLLKSIGDTKEALVEFDKCLKIVPNAREAVEAIKEIKLDDTNILAQSHNLIEKGKDNEAAELLLQHKESIEPIRYYATVCELNTINRVRFSKESSFSPKDQVVCNQLFQENDAILEELKKIVLNHESLIRDRHGKPTRNGLQTHEILRGSDKHAIMQLKKAIVNKIKAEKISNPVLKTESDWNDISKLSGWGVVLNQGGYQKRHIHPEAVLSGVFYIHTPKNTQSNKTREGNLYFPLSENLEVAPKPGLVVVFPSYMSHETIPIKGDDQRICIAFNFTLK